MKNGTLALTRRIGEQTIIQFNHEGKTIELVQTVTGVKGNQVRMSYCAPLSVKVLRAELKE